MKRFLIISLIPMFLLATGGVTLNYLYCNGNLTKVGIDVKACCKDVKKGGCCEKETKLVKVKDAFVKAVYHHLTKALAVDLNIIKPLYISENYTSAYFKPYYNKAPPSKDAPRYILFHSLII